MKQLLSTSLLMSAMGTVAAAVTPPTEPVVLLHGLARQASSMNRMESALQQAGYTVCNIAYPSRRHDVQTLAQEYVVATLQQCLPGYEGRIHFVTHSMGGILVRQLAQDSRHATRIGRVVMLGPPNKGSEIIDHIGNWRVFRQFAGPAGKQLGTGQDSLPQLLGPASFEAGVIAGRISFNPLLSLLLPGENDGKVSVAGTRLEGMQDFLVLRSSHVFIMKNRLAIANTLHFLQHGNFIATHKG